MQPFAQHHRDDIHGHLVDQTRERVPIQARLSGARVPGAERGRRGHAMVPDVLLGVSHTIISEIQPR
jgi:hypothetical protein